MGTTKSSESMTEAEYLRSARSTTQAEVDAAADERGARARYAPHGRSHPAAH